MLSKVSKISNYSNQLGAGLDRDWRFQILLFFFIFGSLAIYYGYFEILFYPPRGIHFIRQTDSLAFASHYYNFDAGFFNPGLFNLHSYDAKAACEFPILYYLYAKLYFVFGETEVIPRLVCVIILFTGLYNLYKLSLIFVKDHFYSLLIPVLLFTSSVVAFYGNNFTPDPIALSLTFIGMRYYFLFLQSAGKRVFIVSMVMFLMLGLIKVTFFIYPIALMCMYFMTVIFKVKIEFRDALSKHKLIGFSFLITAFLIYLWSNFIISYNIEKGSVYFVTYAIPYWKLSSYRILSVWEHITGWWYWFYHYPKVYWLVLMAFAAPFIFYKKCNKYLLFLSLFMVLGSLSFVLLFFGQFQDHDYYMLVVYPAVAFVLMNCFSSLLFGAPSLLKNVLVKSLFILIILKSATVVVKNFSERYYSDDSSFAMVSRLAGINEEMEEKGISPESKVISLGDFTVNASLYFMKRKGWPIADTSEYSLNTFDEAINDGATHILVYDSSFLHHPVITNALGGKLLEYNGIGLYSLNRDIR